MPRRIACSLAFAVAAAGLVWAGWPGRSADPATLINRVGVIATVAILAGLPWVIRRKFGPAARTWRAGMLRAGGYAAVLALMLAETGVARFEYAGAAKRHVLVGVWAGEAAFLVVLAAYVAGLLAVTAQRPPAAAGALAIGARAGAAAGLIMYVLPSMGHPLHAANVWLARLYDAARVLALLLAFGITIAAGIAAARRVPPRGSRLRATDARARHGVAAGLCGGAFAALIVCGLGVSTAALLPHEAARITWTLPDQNLLPSVTVDQHLLPGVTGGRRLRPPPRGAASLTRCHGGPALLARRRVRVRGGRQRQRGRIPRRAHLVPGVRRRARRLGRPLRSGAAAAPARRWRWWRAARPRSASPAAGRRHPPGRRAAARPVARWLPARTAGDRGPGASPGTAAPGAGGYLRACT